VGWAISADLVPKLLAREYRVTVLETFFSQRRHWGTSAANPEFRPVPGGDIRDESLMTALQAPA